jgi:hypothetical protein
MGPARSYARELVLVTYFETRPGDERGGEVSVGPQQTSLSTGLAPALPRARDRPEDHFRALTEPLDSATRLPSPMYENPFCKSERQDQRLDRILTSDVRGEDVNGIVDSDWRPPRLAGASARLPHWAPETEHDPPRDLPATKR